MLNDENPDIKRAREFLKIFEPKYYSLNEYRKNIIKKIKKKYTIEEFYKYEMILDKMFWNIKNKQENEKIKYTTEKTLDEIILAYKKDNIYYRSFINKMFLIDDENKYIYIRATEGSLEGLKKNELNLIISKIFFDDNEYEKFIKNSNKIPEKIKLPKYYYEFDYGFPNLNYSAYNIGSKEYKIKKIQKMYYEKESEKNWYKLIKP